MKYILFILLFSGTISAYSQKNVVAADSSLLTGIRLPAGTKLDKRILSTAAAKYLMDEKLKEESKTGDGTVEVLYMPPDPPAGSKTVFLESLQKSGYKFTTLPGDDSYGILTGKKKEFLVYLGESKWEVSLFISGIMPVAKNNDKAIPVAGKNSEPIPPVTEKAPEQPVVKPVEQTFKPASSGTAYHFTTTNFDDGWIATVQPDYILVTKGNLSVKLYFAVEVTDQMRSYSAGMADWFWNGFVIPQYRVKQAYKNEETLTYFPVYYIFGEATDISTGKDCYIGMNAVVRNGISSVVLSSAPDKASFDAAFPTPGDIEKILAYNRFAVAYEDIVGKWAESSGATAHYYNVYTGAYAGMGFAQGDDEFVFKSDKTYVSLHTGAMGSVGNTTFYNQEYKGNAISGNWDLSLTNRWKGQQDDFHAWFECVKGGRILHLVNKTAPGIKYDLVRVQ